MSLVSRNSAAIEITLLKGKRHALLHSINIPKFAVGPEGFRRKGNHHRTTRRGNAEEVREVLVQDRDLRAEDHEHRQRWEEESRDVVRSSFSARITSHRFHADKRRQWNPFYQWSNLCFQERQS